MATSKVARRNSHMRQENRKEFVRKGLGKKLTPTGGGKSASRRSRASRPRRSSKPIVTG